MLERIEAEYRRRTPRSAAQFLETSKYIAGGASRGLVVFTPHRRSGSRAKAPASSTSTATNRSISSIATARSSMGTRTPASLRRSSSTPPAAPPGHLPRSTSSPSRGAFFLSTAMTEADLDAAINAIREGLLELKPYVRTVAPELL